MALHGGRSKGVEGPGYYIFEERLGGRGSVSGGGDRELSCEFGAVRVVWSSMFAWVDETWELGPGTGRAVRPRH